MKQMKKITAWLLVMVMSLAVLSGCGKKETGEATAETPVVTTTTTTETKETADQTEEKEPIELSMIHYLIEETEGGAALALRDAMNKIKADHPEYVIEEEMLANESYFTKIQTLAAGNELPDIFPIKGSMLDMLVADGLIQPVTQALSEDATWKDNFLPGAFDVFTRNSDIYGIPLSAKATSLVFYNTKIFEEAGITEFPTTFEALKDAVAKIKASGYTPIALGNKGKWVAQSCILSTLADRYTGTDWFMNMNENKGAKFTDEAFVASLTGFQELADLGAFNEDMNSIDNQQQRTEFYNGKAAMFIEGAWAIGGVVGTAPEDIQAVTKIALLPTVDGGVGEANRVSGGASIAWVINGSLEGARLEAAQEILKALSSPKYASIMTEHNEFPAIRPGEYDESKISALTKQYLAIMENTSFTPVYDIYLDPSVVEVINSGLQELLIDLVTPEDLAAKIQKEYERMQQ